MSKCSLIVIPANLACRQAGAGIHVVGLLVSLFLLQTIGFSEELPEVFEETYTQVLVRKHPKTDEEYVTIVPNQEPFPEDPLADGRGKYSRPDYRMLDGRYKNQIDYDGPYSSRKKVYILAASLATLGATGAIVGATAFPAAAGAGATGSALGPGIGVAVTGAATAAATIKLQPKDIPDDYVRASESQLLETSTDFYRFHILKERS